MKKRNLGFALLLFANIFSVPDTFAIYAGLFIGLIGLCLVISGLKSDQ